jgi:hypothetical protein
MAKAGPLYRTLDTLAGKAEAGDLTLGGLISALGAGGFGPLFVLLGGLVALPTGAIPGVPALVGVSLVLLAGQLMLGWRTPWLPRRMRERPIGRDALQAALNRSRPLAARLDRILRERLILMAAGPVALRIAAAAVMLAGAVMIPIGFVPLLPLLLGLPVLAIGLGLMARDGLFVCLGLAAFAAPAWLVLRTLG